MISWRLISRDVVRESGVNVESMRTAVGQMEQARTQMSTAADDLTNSWKRLPEYYDTPGTPDAVGKVGLVERSTLSTRTALDGTISALNGLLAELTGAQARRATLLQEVDALRRQALPLGGFWLTRSDLLLTNSRLWWERDSIVRSYFNALRRCDALLSLVTVDAFLDDPNLGVDEYGEGRFDTVPLFLPGSNGIRGDQVRQGGLGDCWLLASMASLADQNPDLIREMITDNGDGTYTVKLWVDGKRQDFTVDGDFLVGDDGMPVYAGGSQQPNVLWPMILEKAAAQAKGGYEEISGDRPSTAFELFLGDKGKEDHYGGPADWFDEDISPEKLAEMHDQGYVMAASSHQKWFTSKSSYSAGDATVIYGHAYQVADVHVGDNGEVSVTVLNPWNNDPDPTDSDGTNGIQVLTWKEFSGSFRAITYAPTR